MSFNQEVDAGASDNDRKRKRVKFEHDNSGINVDVEEKSIEEHKKGSVINVTVNLNLK